MTTISECMEIGFGLANDPDFDHDMGVPIHMFDPDSKESLDIVGADDLVTQRTHLVIHVIYPLSHPAFIKITGSARGFTRLELFEAICSAYHRIYREEGEAPPPTGMLLNRETTSGPYGIWGHELGDLWLVGAGIDHDGTVELWIES